MEEPDQHHLSVGTEVSAKYRGAFCEAKIKSVKKTVIFRVTNKKDGKIYSVTEEAIKGPLKIGSIVEAQFPDTTSWQDGVIMSAKDKSVYTVEFDDGDVRTLSRGSLCLQGVRHFAESETLDHLPLTDPENFGTPVLSFKRKAKRKTPQSSINDNEEADSDDEKSPDREIPNKRKSLNSKSESKDESIDVVSREEKRKKWLADPLIGRLVLVEPSDKRKHWFPAIVVNPVCIDEVDDVRNHNMVVRSFKNGKITKVNRCEKLTKQNVPSKVEPAWKDVLENAFSWEETGTIPDVWKSDIKDILDEDSKDEDTKDKDSEENEKNHDFLEQLYKFMEDRGSPMNKTPVLGYKDLNLFLLYNLVQAKGGFHNITLSTDWREIYTELGIPKITQAAGHHVKMAYTKYLLSFEEYLMSFQKSSSKMSLKNLPRFDIVATSKPVTKRSSKSTPNSAKSSQAFRFDEDAEVSLRRTSRRRKISETASAADESESTPPKETKRGRKIKSEADMKRDSDIDDASSTASSEKSITRGRISSTASDVTKGIQKVTDRRRSNSGTGGRRKNVIYKIGDKLKVKYGKDSFKLYNAKVVDVEIDELKEAQYYVHYAGWNSRHDEWIKQWRVSGLLNDKNDTPNSPNPSTRGGPRRPKTPTFVEDKKGEESSVLPSPSVSLIQGDFKGISQALDFNTPPAVNSTLNAVKDNSKKDGVSNLIDAFQAESKKTSAKSDAGKRPKKTRMRRRSTSSSTPPPQPQPEAASNKRAASVEKFLPDISSITAQDQSKDDKDDTTSNDEKSSGRSTPPPTVPVGIFPANRRTSGRRSKSPAYLKESALYGLSKRKRTNSCASNTESLTNNEVDRTQEADEISSETSSRSVGSPSEANRASPLTIWSETDNYIEKNAKPELKRMRRKSDEKEKLSQIDEENNNMVKKETYDNFDEEVPDIALEKPDDIVDVKMKETNLLSEVENTEEKKDDHPCSNNEQSDAQEEKKEDAKETTAENKEESSNDAENTSSSNSENSSTSEASKPQEPSSSPPQEQAPSHIPRGAPSSSKVLLENTPPTTPEGSPGHFYDDQEMNGESDNLANGGSGASSLSGGEVLPLSSSPDYPANKDEETAQQEEKDSAGKKGHKRKSRGRPSQGRRSLKSDARSKSRQRSMGESDSDEDGAKNKHSKSRRRPKKKMKPEPPSAPPPVVREELAKMNPDERIQVLQNKLCEMRKVYQQLKQEVSSIDRKRKRAKRREQDANEQPSKKSAPSSPTKPALCTAEDSTSSGENTTVDIDALSTHL